MKSKSESKVNIVSEPVEQHQRIYKQNIRIESDLFKLQTAKAKKNVSWSDGDIQLEEVEHVHFFHTYDSDGRRQDRSAPVGGHFHLVEFEEGKNGKPAKIKSISGPMKMAKVKEKGRWKQKPVPLSEELEDSHTHDIKYLKSDSVQAREHNVNAIQMVGEEAQKTAPIAGVN